MATAQLDDAGFYQIITNGDESFAELIVEEKPIEFKSGFSDMSVNFNESAEFKCEVSEAEAKGKWFKDGKEVVASDRIEVIERGCLRKLVINDVTASDQGSYIQFCGKTFVTDITATSYELFLSGLNLRISNNLEILKIF